MRHFLAIALAVLFAGSSMAEEDHSYRPKLYLNSDGETEWLTDGPNGMKIDEDGDIHIPVDGPSAYGEPYVGDDGLEYYEEID